MTFAADGGEPAPKFLINRTKSPRQLDLWRYESLPPPSSLQTFDCPTWRSKLLLWSTQMMKGKFWKLETHISHIFDWIKKDLARWTQIVVRVSYARRWAIRHDDAQKWNDGALPFFIYLFLHTHILVERPIIFDVFLLWRDHKAPPELLNRVGVSKWLKYSSSCFVIEFCFFFSFWCDDDDSPSFPVIWIGNQKKFKYFLKKRKSSVKWIPIEWNDMLVWFTLLPSGNLYLLLYITDIHFEYLPAE